MSSSALFGDTRSRTSAAPRPREWTLVESEQAWSRQFTPSDIDENVTADSGVLVDLVVQRCPERFAVRK